MGYAQWVRIRITNKSKTRTIKIAYIEALYGKFYNGPDDKDTEIQPAHFINKTIEPQQVLDIYSCGRSDSPSGTEGNVNLVDNLGPEIANIYWSCPYIGSNEFKKTKENSDQYLVALSTPGGGALGDQTVDVAFLG
ncbi:Aegerolysin [Panaeolus papilionaceus]|nr:Aegerolysin [Panaeolus papilionaceus]